MDFDELKNVCGAFRDARIVHVACDYKIFDELALGALDAAELAKRIRTNLRATELLCNALAGMGLLNKSNGCFINSETAKNYLVTSSPLYYGWIIKHSSQQWKSWGRLGDCLKTGEPVTSPSDGFDLEAFIMGMHSIVTARGDAELLSDKLGLEKTTKMLDVGGGPGTFPIGFCRRHKKLNAVVFDLPPAVAIARKNLTKFQDVADRISFAEGDYLATDLPRGFDMVFLSNVIHSNNEEQCAMLIKKSYQALNPGGRIVIKDHIMNEDLTLPAMGSSFAINMLLHTNGRDYSFNEIKNWMTDAGFSKITTIDLPKNAEYGVVIGVK